MLIKVDDFEIKLEYINMMKNLIQYIILKIKIFMLKLMILKNF